MQLPSSNILQKDFHFGLTLKGDGSDLFEMTSKKGKIVIDC